MDSNGTDIGQSWQLNDFDDSEWNTAQTGIGFGYGFPDLSEKEATLSRQCENHSWRVHRDSLHTRHPE